MNAAPRTAARTCDTRADRPTTAQGTPVHDARASCATRGCPFRGSPFVYDATTPLTKEHPMKYMLLIHQGDAPTPRDPEAWAKLSADEQKQVWVDYQAVNQAP